MANEVEPAGSDPSGGSSTPVIATVPGGGDLEQPRRVVAGPMRLGRMFSALRHGDYRLYFFGQAVSLTGTWTQLMAEGWLVYQLTASTVALGAVRFLHTIPVTLFAVYAGVVADRFDRRRILITTQTVAMILAFGLFGLAVTGTVKVWHVGLLAAGLGLAQAFDIPARHSFVIDMVGREDLMNAIALNSSIFNGARIIGPAVGGLIVSGFGVAPCFLVNAVSFGAVIFSYTRMRAARKPAVSGHSPAMQATREALREVVANPVLRRVMTLVAVVSLFALPYTVLLPVYAAEILQVGAGGFGLLLSVNGVGALIGALSLTLVGDYPRKLRLVFAGAFGLSLMLIIFALSRYLWLSALALAYAGWFMILFFSTANTVVQLHTPDPLRGRVLGIYSFCFIGLSPLGSLTAGYIARYAGVPATLALGASICLAAGLGILLRLFHRT